MCRMPGLHPCQENSGGSLTGLLRISRMVYAPIALPMRGFTEKRPMKFNALKEMISARRLIQTHNDGIETRQPQPFGQ